MTYLANTWKETHTPRHEGLFFKHFPTQKSIPTTRFGRHREFSPKSRPSRYFIYKQVRKCLKGLTTLPYTVDGGKSMRIHPDAGNISDIFEQKWGTRKLVCPWLKQTPDICIATTNQYAKVNNSWEERQVDLKTKTWDVALTLQLSHRCLIRNNAPYSHPDPESSSSYIRPYSYTADCSVNYIFC